MDKNILEVFKQFIAELNKIDKPIKMLTMTLPPKHYDDLALLLEIRSHDPDMFFTYLDDTALSIRRGKYA